MIFNYDYVRKSGNYVGGPVVKVMENCLNRTVLQNI
jgi:hypothetical protein